MSIDMERHVAPLEKGAGPGERRKLPGSSRKDAGVSVPHYFEAKEFIFKYFLIFSMGLRHIPL